MKIKDLKQRLGETVDKAAQFRKKAADENRLMTTEERESWDKAFKEIFEIKENIRIAEASDAVDADLSERRDRRAAETGTEPELQRKAFVEWLRRGYERLAPELRSKLVIPRDSVEFRGNPQSDVTGNLGQYTVPQDFYAAVITALKYYAGMLQCGATMINTGEGRDLPVPTSNDTSTMGIELSENTAVTTPTEVPFGQVILHAYKYTTRLILIPIELMQDSAVDIEAYIIKMLGIRLGRILNNRFTTGDGSSKPRGIVIDSVLGATGTTGKSQKPQYNDLIELKYSVDKLYRTSAKWMMSDTTWKACLELVDGNGRPLVLGYLTGLTQDASEMLLSQEVVINNDMANFGTNGSPVAGNIAVLYGAFENYWIRTVMEMVMLRLVERYAEYAQVGLIGFARYDGRMVDAGTNPVKYLQSPTT